LPWWVGVDPGVAESSHQHERRAVGAQSAHLNGKRLVVGPAGDDPVVALAQPAFEVVPESEVQRQSRGHANIVLGETAPVVERGVDRRAHRDAAVRGEAEEKARKRIAGPWDRRVGIGTERELPREVEAAHSTDVLEPDAGEPIFPPKFQRVPAEQGGEGPVRRVRVVVGPIPRPVAKQRSAAAIVGDADVGKLLEWHRGQIGRGETKRGRVEG